MLSSKQPELNDLSRYMDRFSEHRGSAAYSIGQDSRFKLRRRSASLPGPGHYRVDRSFPLNDDEVACDSFSSASFKYTLAVEPRTTEDGTLKGIALKSQPLGPGQYPVSRLNLISKEKSCPAYTFPMAKETAEALRARKQGGASLGPGAYKIERYGDALGREKQRCTERALRHGTVCKQSAQYSHLFACMKPRRGN
mmetsp:Transcript_46519/g.92456  ORF Transcript_46519/g.92456 Transcript_46519/m.92456 type:complete len:196 (+) Transcript_46519:103-690(+)